MRNAFIKSLHELARKDERVVLLVGDLGYKIFDDFKKEFPARFYNVGIAEANMVSMAAGLCLEGFKPFVYSIAPFVTLRCCEQIRNDLCYNNKNVVVVGMGGGYTYGHNGPTHHAIEDIAIMRAMPNMKVVCPGDSIETAGLMKSILEENGPVYLRLSKEEGEVHPPEPYCGLFKVGRSHLFSTIGNILIISTGNMLYSANKVCEILGKKRFFCDVLSMHTVKPLDIKTLDIISKRMDYIFSLEEHSVVGGLGSAIAEYLAEKKEKVKFKRIGINDCFAEVSGDQQYLRSLESLDINGIVGQIEEFVNER